MTDTRWPASPLPRGSEILAARWAALWRILRARYKLADDQVADAVALLLTPNDEDDVNCAISSMILNDPDAFLNCPWRNVLDSYGSTTAYYLVANPIPYELPFINFAENGTWTLARVEPLYHRAPLAFVAGNRVVADSQPWFRLRNGMWALRPGYQTNQSWQLCPLEGTGYPSPYLERLDITDPYIDGDPTRNRFGTSWNLGPYAGLPVEQAQPPALWQPNLYPGRCPLWYVPDAWPAVLGVSPEQITSNPGPGRPPRALPPYAQYEITFDLAVGLPEPLQTLYQRGAVALKWKGASLSGRAVYDSNGNWEIEVSGQQTLTIGMRRGEASLVQDVTFRALRRDGNNYVEVANRTLSLLEAAGLTLTTGTTTERYIFVLTADGEFDFRYVPPVPIFLGLSAG